MATKMKRYKVVFKTKEEPRFFGEYYIEAKNVDDAKMRFEEKYGDKFKAIKSLLVKNDVDKSVKELKSLTNLCFRYKFILITYYKNDGYSIATVREEGTNKERILIYENNMWTIKK